MLCGSSVTNVSWPLLSAGGSERSDCLFIERKQLCHHPICQERGKIVKGSCLSLARTVRCQGNTNYSRGTDSSVNFQELTLSTKTLMEGLKFLFGPAKAWPFTQNTSRCQQIVSREELGIKLSSGCGWFFFMPSYPNKESEPEAKSASEHTEWNWCMGMHGALPD